jgi:hypothetical protein
MAIVSLMMGKDWLRPGDGRGTTAPEAFRSTTSQPDKSVDPLDLEL